MSDPSKRATGVPAKARAHGARDAPDPSEAGRPPSSEEMALVERLLTGDEIAFTALVHRYQGHLLRLAQVFVADRETAEEVVQETWLAVLNGLPGFEGRSALKTWIFRILINRARTRGSREARSIPLSSLNPEVSQDEPAVDPARFGPNGMWADPPRLWQAETPEGLLLRGEAVAALLRAIGELPPNLRAVVTLRDIEGLSSEDTCNALEISETNQRVLLHRARSKLRTALEKQFAEG